MEINCSISRIMFCHQAKDAELLMEAGFTLIKTEDLCIKEKKQNKKNHTPFHLGAFKHLQDVAWRDECHSVEEEGSTV